MTSRPVQIKILVMGDKSVGKTTAIEHFKSKTFQPSYFPTVEPVMTPFQLKTSNEPVAVHLWELGTDTPVTSKRVFDKIDGVILAFDAANASTFNSLEKCLQILFEVDRIYFKDNIPFTICQLKIDRDPHQKIPKSSVCQSSSGDQHDILFQIQKIEKKMSTGFLRIENKLNNLEKRVSKLERASSKSKFIGDRIPHKIRDQIFG